MVYTLYIQNVQNYGINFSVIFFVLKLRSKIGYVEVETLRGHKNYVASVCILTPTPSFPCGLVLTGGYDKQILGFEPQSTDPIIEHEAHEDAGRLLV